MRLIVTLILLFAISGKIFYSIYAFNEMNISYASVRYYHIPNLLNILFNISFLYILVSKKKFFVESRLLAIFVLSILGYIILNQYFAGIFDLLNKSTASNTWISFLFGDIPNLLSLMFLTYSFFSILINQISANVGT